MQLIPVIDLIDGVAVQAKAGDRSRYQPVESVLTPGRAGDALALVQAYREQVGARECYVADLDAIQGGEPQRGLLRELARVAAPCTLLVDAGTSSPAAANQVLAIGAFAAVVGLETLRRFESLSHIVAAIPPERVIFSLDLRHGRPMVPSGTATEVDPVDLAARAVDAGIGALLVLDVGRVGTGAGVDLDLLRRIRRRFPRIRLLAGGGVAGVEDLAPLADAGCDGALVATALHSGRIGQSRTSASRQVADCP